MRADDRIVSVLSHWLARHVGDDELRAALERIGTAELAPEQEDAVRELLEELENGGGAGRGELEMLVRETLEALALGG
jgi:hypothetical protein